MADTPAQTRLAVLGSPIAHSQSPALHRAAYRAIGLDWQYDAVRVEAGGFDAFVATLDRGWRGLSVTMPLKREAFQRVDEPDRVARLTGSVNTVLFRETDGRRTAHGFNTDVAGLVRALAEAGIGRAAHVRILGAGGTAAAALVAAADLGAESADLLVRTPAKAAALSRLGQDLGLIVTVSGLSAVARPDEGTDLVISTLPGGVELAGEFPAGLRRRAVLFDVSYSPWPNRLAASWAAVGGTALSGLGLLLHQALLQVRIFVGGDPFEPLAGEDGVLAAMRGALTRPAVEG